jgi:hypothetical protein
MAPVPGTKWLRCSTSAAMRSRDKRSVLSTAFWPEADVIIAPMFALGGSGHAPINIAFVGPSPT